MSVSSRFALAAVLACWAPVILAAGLPAGQAEAPELLIEGPGASSPAAAGIRRISPDRLRLLTELIGLDRRGDPIHLLLLDEDSEAARDTPAWVAGYADGASDLIVLFPERSPSYPHADFESLVVHEIAHVLIDRAVRGRSVPRWFHEGLASVSGEWGLGDRMRMSLAMIFGDVRSLGELDEAFRSGDPDRIARAYALATAFVRELQAREGRGVAARILAARESGDSFEAAFEEGTGISLAEAERLFWNTGASWSSWIQVLANSTVVWTAIALLAGWAFLRRRARSARIRARWEEEEAARDPAARRESDDPGGA